MEVDARPTIGALKEHARISAFLQADRRTSGFCFVNEEEKDKETSSDQSSSIGAPSSSSNNEVDGDEVQSQLKESPLGSLDSLEDSLPIKRGLSNFFAGKSKSYATLSDAASSGELAKPENPFNKRRRILVTCKASWSRRASCSLLLHSQLPLDDDDEEDDGDPAPPLPSKSSSLFLLPPPVVIIHKEEENDFKSRSFSLSNLHRHA